MVEWCPSDVGPTANSYSWLGFAHLSCIFYWESKSGNFGLNFWPQFSFTHCGFEQSNISAIWNIRSQVLHFLILYKNLEKRNVCVKTKVNDWPALQEDVLFDWIVFVHFCQMFSFSDKTKQNVHCEILLTIFRLIFLSSDSLRMCFSESTLSCRFYSSVVESFTCMSLWFTTFCAMSDTSPVRLPSLPDFSLFHSCC